MKRFFFSLVAVCALALAATLPHLAVPIDPGVSLTAEAVPKIDVIADKQMQDGLLALTLLTLLQHPEARSTPSVGTEAADEIDLGEFAPEPHLRC